MSTRSWVAILGLWAVLAGSVAHAQKVVVLEFEGDKKGKLRKQVEDALDRARVVDLVSIKKYKDIAAKRKIKQSMTPGGVAKMSRPLNFDAAVEGALSDSFFVRILDPNGKELWSKDLPQKKGMISADHARKLAKAIAAAAKLSPAAEKEPPPKEDPPEEAEEEAPPKKAEKKEEPPPAEEAPREERREERRPVVTEAPTESPSSEERARRRREDMAEAHTDTETDDRDSDLETEKRKAKRGPGPKLVTVSVVGATTWRSYCSTPGVTQSCSQYDPTNPDRPKGDTVEFSAQVPYAGFGVGLELFPLASSNEIFKGLGIAGSYSRGFSLTTVRVETPSGETPEKQVVSVDQAIAASALFRYFFGMGPEFKPLTAYVGLRVGIQSRSFDVDPSAAVPLPGSHRFYPAFGADASIPISKLFRIEAGASYFLNPKAGDEEIAGYGNKADPTGGAVGRGFSVEAGAAGDIWGPLGYTVRFRLTSYADKFFGAGQKWPCDETQCGGVAEESYATLYWGVTAAF